MTRSLHVSRTGVLTAVGALVALVATVTSGELTPEDIADPDALQVPEVVAPSEPPPPDAPDIEWTPCRDGFECATVQVPLDYDRPTAAVVDLAVIRLPAAEPEQRIGSLFVNPGGPGGSGVDVVRGVGQFTPLEIRARYDLVGFDPRGIMRSTPVRCFDSLEDVFEVLPPLAFPVTPEEEEIWERSDRAVANACVGRAGAIIDHMSTANVARDLNLLRLAVGDDELNYLGFSYGSYLGVTYANMFPDSVGALVVDGVLDPVAWSTGRGEQASTQPFSTRLRSDRGASRTLGQFFRLCDQAGADCAFSGDAEARYERLAERLLAEPIVIEDPPFTFTFTYADLVANTLGALYAPFIWPDFAAFLADLEALAPAPQLRERLAAVHSALGVDFQIEQEYPNFVEGFPGVACSDSDNPADYAAWAEAADASEARFRYFGRLWTWISSICQPWPGEDQDRYMGPWRADTSSPVLVVGNYFDPATRYAGAVTVSRLLPNSRLLSYAGWGHTAYLGGNFCIDSTVTRYLVTRELPAEGTVCAPAGSPFGPLSADARARAQATAPIRAAVLPEPLRQAMADDVP